MLGSVLSQASRPYHLEAYPRLDLRAALRRVRSGRALVVWQDQDHELVGQAHVTIAKGSLSIEATFRHSRYIPHGRFHHDLPCSVVSRAGEDDDALANCPKCGETIRVVVFSSGSWFCRNCQGLAHRTNIIGKHLRETERFADLTRQLSGGRPRYMRQARFNALEAERLSLKYLLDGDFAEAKPRQRWLLTSRWIADPAQMLRVASFEPGGPADEADMLERTGDPLFTGPLLAKLVERTIRDQVGPMYKNLRATRPKVTALQVRRQLSPDIIGAVPKMGSPDAIQVGGNGADALATLTVPFTGDPRLFQPAPPRSRKGWHPRALIVDTNLVLGVRFSPANLVFVPALLHVELDLMREYLATQAEAVRVARATFPAVLKRIVAQQLDKVRPRRRRP